VAWSGEEVVVEVAGPADVVVAAPSSPSPDEQPIATAATSAAAATVLVHPFVPMAARYAPAAPT
jgi:hypothetical protein